MSAGACQAQFCQDMVGIIILKVAMGDGMNELKNCLAEALAVVIFEAPGNGMKSSRVGA